MVTHPLEPSWHPSSPWFTGNNTPDRRSKADIETTSHVTSNCQVNLLASGRRHEEVLEALMDTIQKVGNESRVNKVFPDTFLRPDIVVSSTTPPNIIDVTIPFDAPDLFAGLDQKIEKYRQLWRTIIFYIGGLGSWLLQQHDASLGVRHRASINKQSKSWLVISDSIRIIVGQIWHEYRPSPANNATEPPIWTFASTVVFIFSVLNLFRFFI